MRLINDVVSMNQASIIAIASIHETGGKTTMISSLSLVKPWVRRMVSSKVCWINTADIGLQRVNVQTAGNLQENATYRHAADYG